MDWRRPGGALVDGRLRDSSELADATAPNSSTTLNRRSTTAHNPRLFGRRGSGIQQRLQLVHGVAELVCAAEFADARLINVEQNRKLRGAAGKQGKRMKCSPGFKDTTFFSVLLDFHFAGTWLENAAAGLRPSRAPFKFPTTESQIDATGFKIY